MSRWIVRAGDVNLAGKWRAAFDLAMRIASSGLAAELIVRPRQWKRTLAQNRKMWAMLHDIARCIPWIVNDELQPMSPGEWKDLLTAYLRRDRRIARGIDGGLVILGLSTRRMTLAQMADLITLMQAFGDERGVAWTDPDTLEAEPVEDELQEAA